MLPMLFMASCVYREGVCWYAWVDCKYRESALSMEAPGRAGMLYARFCLVFFDVVCVKKVLCSFRSL